jgi:hypothetical protein
MRNALSSHGQGISISALFGISWLVFEGLGVALANLIAEERLLRGPFAAGIGAS